MSPYTRSFSLILLFCIGVAMLIFGAVQIMGKMTREEPAVARPSSPAIASPAVTAPSTPPPLNVPEEYQEMVVAAAERCPTVPIEILAAQIQVESDWDPQARSTAGARGIAQFMKATWKAYSVDGDGDGKRNIWNPADAIVSASVYNCALLNYVKNVPGDRVTLMLAAYNAGPGSVRKYDGIPPYPETQQYVEKVMSASERIVPFWLPPVPSVTITPSPSSSLEGNG